VHDVALVELHDSMDTPPPATTVGFAANVAVGRTLAATVTVAVAGALAPPGPEQISEYVVLAVTAPVLFVPLVAKAPVQPPDAVHEVALVEPQVSVDVPPAATTVGFAVNVAVGRTLTLPATVTVAVTAALEPPGPEQVSE
jgi:hypothetical protein